MTILPAFVGGKVQSANDVIGPGLVGLGKIARDKHLPAIAQTPGIESVAVDSRNAQLDGVACFLDLDSILAGKPGLDPVVMCQPAPARYAAACAALAAGCHVLLEMPPGATLSEVEALADLALRPGVALFLSSH